MSSHGVSPVYVSVFQFPPAYEGISLGLGYQSWIRVYPNQVWPHLNLIISAKTLYLHKVTFSGSWVFWGHSSTQGTGCVGGGNSKATSVPQNQLHTDPILFLKRYWIVFQRQQNKTASRTAKAYTEEKILTSNNTWNQSFPPTHRTKGQGHECRTLSERRVHCPGRSGAEASLP